MKKIALLVTFLITLAGLQFFEACQSAKSSTASKMMKFNLEKGKGYDYEMTMNLDQDIMSQKVQMKMIDYHSMEVK